MREKSSVASSSGAPAWMVTFADLMALMMTFFVLLYSFSRIDEQKYKTIVNSMATGFDGVQWIKRRLRDGDIIGPEPGIVQPPVPPQLKPELKQQPLNTGTEQEASSKNPPDENEQLFTRLQQGLEKEISADLIHVEYKDTKVVIRLPEDISFTSGSDILLGDFIPVLHRIGILLEKTTGKVIISGHTDDRPISTERFRSNWDLSASRAISVAHHFLDMGHIGSKQIIVVAYADTKPLAPNTSETARARNRRVEINIVKDVDEYQVTK